MIGGEYSQQTNLIFIIIRRTKNPLKVSLFKDLEQCQVNFSMSYGCEFIYETLRICLLKPLKAFEGILTHVDNSDANNEYSKKD